MKHRIFQQQGNIALVMVVVLMTTALLLLKALHFYQENARNEFLKEKNMLKHLIKQSQRCHGGFNNLGLCKHLAAKNGNAREHQSTHGKAALNIIKVLNLFSLVKENIGGNMMLRFIAGFLLFQVHRKCEAK